MGAENAISALIDSMLDTLLPEPQPGEEVDPDQQSYAQQIKSFVRKGLESPFGFADGAVNMSSVTHNRVYLSPDKPFLTFETLIPYMVDRSEEHTSELQSQMCISYAVRCFKQKNINYHIPLSTTTHQHLTVT